MSSANVGMICARWCLDTRIVGFELWTCGGGVLWRWWWAPSHGCHVVLEIRLVNPETGSLGLEMRVVGPEMCHVGFDMRMVGPEIN